MAVYSPNPNSQLYDPNWQKERGGTHSGQDLFRQYSAGAGNIIMGPGGPQDVGRQALGDVNGPGISTVMDPTTLQSYRAATGQAISGAQDLAGKMQEKLTPEQVAGLYSTAEAPFRAAGDQLRRAAAVTGSPTALAGNLKGLAQARGLAGGNIAAQIPGLNQGLLAQKEQATLMPGQLALGGAGQEIGGITGGYGAQTGRYGTSGGLIQDQMQNILGLGNQLTQFANAGVAKQGQLTHDLLGLVPKVNLGKNF